MSTKLVNKSQVKSALGLKGPFGNAIAGAAMYVAGLNKINDLYSYISTYQGVEFAQKLLEHLNITCDFNEQELDYIPKQGPCIVVSNHPFGAIDGIIMLAYLGKIRPDIKILTNFILSYIPNLEGHFFPVNPFTDKPGLRSSLKGLRLATEHYSNGGLLALFPAGEVSSNANRDRVVRDIDWQESIVKLIRGAKVPVVPLYFNGCNSKFFHLIGKISPYLRTIRLPHELINKKDKCISLRLGRAIMPTEIEEFNSNKELGRFLWNRCYALEANIIDSVAENSNNNSYSCQIAERADESVLIEEMAKLSNKALFEVNKYRCYLVDSKEIPNILIELGRCREVAFRAVGEGANKAIDTDEYDTYYKHLILWDLEKNRIVGAYRLGYGEEILKRYGVKGLYTNSLFNYKEDFVHYLEHSIELGRSFVSLEYQKDPLALMLLIKGLMFAVLEKRDVRYLVGPVSISAWYPMFYRSLMWYYLRENQFLPNLSKYLSPIYPFKPNYNRVNVKELLANKQDSVEKFDRFLFRLSNNRFRLPTLLKKYLKLNAKILEFNVDPDFNYCVDGLIMLDVLTIPKQEIDLLCKGVENRDYIYERFGIEQQE